MNDQDENCFNLAMKPTFINVFLQPVVSFVLIGQVRAVSVFAILMVPLSVF